MKVFVSVIDSGHTKSTAAFGKQFTVEADKPICHSPDGLLASGDGRFNQASSSERSLQRDAVLDQCLREEQQRKLLSGGGRYQAMQVCSYGFAGHGKCNNKFYYGTGY